jgi:Methyltransferase domain
MFSLDRVTPDMKTLETGADSTLIFAMGGSEHTAVAPFGDEMEEMRNYTTIVGIDTSRVACVALGSEKYLPTLTMELDIVFIDGMHAFPWPILDWYSTADHLKVGGLMIIHDTQLPSVGILSEFLRADSPRWLFAKTVGGRTDVLKKIAASIHDVAWHEQPWVAAHEQPGVAGRRPFHRRVSSRLHKLGGILR